MPFTLDLEKLNLNKEQMEAVKTVEGPVCVIAGAGSGKTKALTSRIAYMLSLGIKPWSILAITFTNKAAREMKERVAKLINDKNISDRIILSTFHSFCCKILRYEVKHLKEISDGFTILDSDDQLAMVKTIVKEMDLDVEKFNPSDMLRSISAHKNNMIPWDKVDISMNSMEFINIYRTYQEMLQYYNRCDFDDLLVLTVKLFKENPQILEKYQNHFKYILIDEYQDTNPVQYKLANMLAEKNKNLFVVGDVDQAIYGFRGSDFRNILNFKEDYPEYKLIKLERNYRSTQVILDAANAVIANNSQRIPKNLWTEDKSHNPIIASEVFDQDEEAQWVLRKIRSEAKEKHTKLKDICILVRNNAQTQPFEDIFVRNSIPYIIVGARRFYDRKEIKDVIAYLRVLQNQNDMMSLKRIINVPKRGIGERSFAKLEAYCRAEDIGFLDAIDMLETQDALKVMFPKKAKESLLSLKASIEHFSEDTEGEEPLPVDMKLYNFLEEIHFLDQYDEKNSRKEDVEANKTRKDNVFTLLNVARDFRKNPKERTLENLLDHISLISDADTIKEDENRVTVMTMHASKGLEYPVIFLVGFEETILPSIFACMAESISGDQNGIEEERRLCYVAITRAKKQLYLSYASQRTKYTRVSHNMRSRFYDEIPSHLIYNEQDRTY